MKRQNRLKLLMLVFAVLFFPFWRSITLGLIFGAALGPFHRFIAEKFQIKRRLGSVVVMAFITLLLALVIAIMMLNAWSFLHKIIENPSDLTSITSKIFALFGSITSWISSIKYLPSDFGKKLFDLISNYQSEIPGIIARAAKVFILTVPEMLLGLAVFTASFMGMLQIERRFLIDMANVLEIGPIGYGDIFRFEVMCWRTLSGIFILGAGQSVLVVAGAAAAGFHDLTLIFYITFIFSMIPVLGAVSVPLLLCVFCAIQGESSGAIILAITFVITGIVDQILKAVLFTRYAKMNPVVSLLALFGSMSLFGFPGLLIAPLAQELAKRAYDERMKETEEIEKLKSKNAQLTSPGSC